MSRIRGPFCSAVAVVLLTACGSNSTTSEVATSTARGTLIENPPLRIASLDAAALTSQLNASASGQSLLALASAPACGVDFYYIQYWTVGAANETATATGALMVPTGAAAECSGPRPIVLYAHGTNTHKSYNIADITNPSNTEGALDCGDIRSARLHRRSAELCRLRHLLAQLSPVSERRAAVEGHDRCADGRAQRAA